MNKTRMGKRVASLLLSLVMMLSLLPTAAYAAMGDADETQGASVSENGTRVSDDSNSGGDTGDLQVGDSEDGGNTGDQKVEGSNGSNTVGDTAGTEGGADPTDSVNENDSTLVTPSNRVEVNGTVYDTLEAAIAAAEPVNGVITYEIYGKVEANSTESWIEVLKAGLTDVTKVAFVGKTDDAEISITNSTSVLADQNYDIDVSFVDLTLSHSNGAWVGDIGHATEYFTCVLRNTDAANNTVTYTNCTFPNGACNNQYGKTVFVNCEFTNTTSGKYNLWNYGGTTEITKSAFTGTRGIKTYNEGTLAESPEVAIKDTTFTGLTEKAAIVASKPTDIKLDSISATECTKGVFQKDIEGSADAEKVTIEANGSGISGNFNVTAEKTTEAAKDEFNITAGSFTAEVPSDYCAEGFTIEKKADGSYGVKENQPSANVAKVGDTEYATLGEAIAALSSSSYTLELLDESAWDVATPVYWAAGSESGYVATLADALTAAYMANAGGITIVCRPGTDVGKLTHGHVADNITIYGNNAYISSGECDLEVDTYMFSRDTGKQVTTGGAYLDKDITVTAYELDNLGVWGQRHTGHKVTVNLTDCDSVHGITVQRVYISGTTGVNDITLTGCDFGTKATSVYSNADGKVVIDNCSFTGAQVPVNFNHKANGTQTVTVQNSKFTNCGDNGDWKQFAAPVRFVNSGSGTMNTTVGTCTFTDTVGGNGDILLGDGREGEKSNNVSLTVENTAANVQAQQPGYYAKNGTTDESKQGTKNVAADDKLTTSVTQLMPSSETTYVAEVKGVKYKSLQAAIDKAGRNATVKLLADTRENVTIAEMMTLDLNGHTLNGGQVKAKPALTVTARVTVKDSSAAKTGTIMREDTAENSGVSSHYVIDIQGKGWLTFESGNVKNNSGTDSGKGASLVRVGDDSVDKYPGLNIKGGTFTQDNFIVIKVDSGDLFLNGGTLNSANSYAVENWHRAAIKGGTVNGTVAAWTYSGGHNSTLTISGGTVNDNVASVSYDKAEGKVAKVSITGGTVTGTLGTYTYGNGLIPIEDPAKATIAVTGGTFSKDPSKYVVENSGVTPNGDGTFGVAKAYLAKVGDTSYYTMTEAINAAQDGQTVRLLADVAEDVVISKSIALDLGGKTLTNTNAGKATISVQSGTVTVKNGNVVGGNDYYNIEVTKGSNANLTLTDVAATAGNTGSSMIDNWGTLTITSGTYTGGLDTVKNEPSAKLNITGGTFTLTKGNSNGFTGVVFNYGELTISGGEFIQSDKSAPYGQAQVIHTDKDKNGSAAPSTVITGGTFKNLCTRTTAWTVRATNAADGATKVSGGAFNKEVKDYYCADGFIPTKNADGTYGVKEGKFVAEVGSKKYETLADAIRLATKGKTVKLLADVEQNTQLTINKSITLDLNGKTIRNTVDIWGDKANAILSITNGAKVTITGNGTIDAKENDCYTINVAKGDLTIENGTFYGNVSVVQVEEGTLSVKGGTFDLHQKWEGSSKYLFNCIDSEFTSGNAKVAISGGTFVGFDPNVSPEQKVDGKTPSFAAPGVGITKNENGSFTAAAGMTAQILDKDGNSVKAYNTLAEAVAAAQDGQTVRLLADVTLNEQIATGKAITIDGQSKYTIKTVKKLASVDGKAGMFYRTQSAKGTLTFLNVTLDGGGVSKIFLNEGGAGETVFDGVTSTNGGGIAYGSGIHISGGGSHATIRNSTLTGSTGTMELNDANYYAANDLWVGGNVYVTVENSVIGNVFVNSAPSATATNGVVHGQLTITGEKTKITYLSGEEEAADKLDKFGNNGSLVKIDSGYVEKVFDKGSYAISGGTFKTEVKKEWCAAGYVPTQNGDGTYGVAEGKFTVQVTSRTTGSDSPVANVAGGGSDITYAVGTTVTASAISGYKFVGWFVNEYTGTAYSTDLTCEVKPTDDWTMIAVYEPISGGKFWLNVTASEFTVNGGAVQDSYLYEQFAVGASVTVNFTGSENFLYWVNASNKVVSTEKSYTFVMGSETTLKAVYGKARQNQATVVFISHSDQIISSKAYTTNDTIQFPVPPIKMGCTFTGWSMTEAEIRAAMANNSGIIQVRARYTEPSIACKVTVIYPDGIGNDVVNAVVGKAVNVTAKDIEGKTFSYWTDNAGNVLGYTKTLNLAPSGDMTVKAVYDEAAEAKPVITISEVSATTANESYVVTFMATRAVPDGYKVVKQGILWSRDAVCGEDGAAAYMQFDSNGKLPTGVNAYIGNSLELNGVTRLDITTKYNDRTFYGRGYMVLESDAGELLYIYTNTIESGSYDSLTK